MTHTPRKEPVAEDVSPGQAVGDTLSPAGTDGSGAFLVRAAGAVLWREASEGDVEIAVVHRPRYDDWSLPKGKLDPGETIAHAAAREVTEETGLTCVLSRKLLQVSYTVPTSDGDRADKLVDYFTARVVGGTFLPNEEVDRLRWVRPEDVRDHLSYAQDVAVVEEFRRIPTGTATLLLVRHAKAGSRSEFSGDDRLRPLSDAGMRQQRALHTLLPLFGPERVYSAPVLRCEQTVAPVAEDLGVDIASESLLSEEGYRPDPTAAEHRLRRIAALPGTALVCSQGGVIPDVVTRLIRSSGLSLEDVTSTKASVWILTFRPGTPADNGSGSLPALVAADQLPEPVSGS